MIIGLSGKKGSGKSTVAEYLRKRYDFEELAFATALKRACIEIFGLSEHQVFGTQEDKEKIDPFWKVSPRQILQTVGSTVRNLESVMPQFKSIWIRRVESDMNKIIATTLNPQIVVSDVRYPDEAELIRSVDGIIINIDRLQADLCSDPHESEIQYIEADYIIYNDADKDYLFGEIDKIILNKI